MPAQNITGQKMKFVDKLIIILKKWETKPLTTKKVVGGFLFFGIA